MIEFKIAESTTFKKDGVTGQKTIVSSKVNLKKITVSDDVTSVTIPDEVNSIDSYAIPFDNGIEEIKFNDGSQMKGQPMPIALSIDRSKIKKLTNLPIGFYCWDLTLSSYSSQIKQQNTEFLSNLEEVTFSKTIKKINCNLAGTHVKEIIVPDSVRDIASDSFIGMPELNRFEINLKSIFVRKKDAFMSEVESSWNCILKYSLDWFKRFCSKPKEIIITDNAEKKDLLTSLRFINNIGISFKNCKDEQIRLLYEMGEIL